MLDLPQPHNSVRQLEQQFSMPTPQPEQGRQFATRFDQMRYWLTDPILRPEAIAWLESNGYDLNTLEGSQ